MTRRAPQAADRPPAPETDPLADLREPAEGTPVQANDDPEPEGEEADIRPMVTEETFNSMVSEAVAALHADLTCQGFLHGGAACGCRFIAKVALAAAVPVVSAQDLEDRELDPPEVTGG